MFAGWSVSSFYHILVTVQNRTHVHMNFFASNHTYYHFPKYCRFLLNHPVYTEISVNAFFSILNVYFLWFTMFDNSTECKYGYMYSIHTYMCMCVHAHTHTHTCTHMLAKYLIPICAKFDRKLLHTYGWVYIRPHTWATELWFHLQPVLNTMACL